MAAESTYSVDDDPFALETSSVDEERERAIWWALQLNAHLHMGQADRDQWAAWVRDNVTDGGPLEADDWPGWGGYIDLPRFKPPKITFDPSKAMGTKEPSTRFILYRLVGFDDRVLYVGVTRNLEARRRAHRRKFGRVIARVLVECYPDAETMLEAEAAAIHDERPPLNISGL